VERVSLAAALHRVPVSAVPASQSLPGFDRSTVDGFAVRAADTYGASESLPSYLDLLGAVRMGAAPTVAVRPGGCVAMPTGGVLPAGADAVVMVEYTAETMPGTVEVTRPVAPGGGLVRADEDVAAGAALVPAGRPLRAPDLGLLAAAGVTTADVHARPRVAILSTGDEVVPPDTAELAPGQVRDATASALAGLITDAGGQPVGCAVRVRGPDRVAVHGGARKPGQCVRRPDVGDGNPPQQVFPPHGLARGAPLRHEPGQGLGDGAGAEELAAGHNVPTRAQRDPDSRATRPRLAGGGPRVGVCLRPSRGLVAWLAAVSS
jgi:hypothetical protein